MSTVFSELNDIKKYEGSTRLTSSFGIDLSPANILKKTGFLSVIGDPKTVKNKFLTPNLDSCNSSFVITDIDGELYKEHWLNLTQRGYTVECISFSKNASFETTIQYDPFLWIQGDDIRSKQEAFERLIRKMIPSDGTSGDPFWNSAAQVVCMAAALGTFDKYPDDNTRHVHFWSVLEAACSIKEDGSTEADELFKDPELSEETRRYWSDYNGLTTGGSGIATKKSIATAVMRHMIPFLEFTMKNKGHEFRIEDLYKKKTALFIVTDSDTDTALPEVFVYQLFSALLAKTAESLNNSKAKPGPECLYIVLTDPRVFTAWDQRFIEVYKIASGIITADSIKLLEKNQQSLLRYFSTRLFIGNNDYYTCNYISSSAIRTAKVEEPELSSENFKNALTRGKAVLLLPGEKPFIDDTIKVIKHDR